MKRRREDKEEVDDDSNNRSSNEEEDIVYSDNNNEEDESEDESDSIFQASSAPKLPKTLNEKASQRRVIIVLQKAALNTVKTKQVIYSS